MRETCEKLCKDGVRGEAYAHELVKTVPGRSADYIRLVRDVAIPAYQKYGWELCGAFETAMVNDSECIILWAIPTWEQWAAFEAAQRRDDVLARWRDSIRDIAVDWHRCLLVDSPLAPLRTGRQPLEADRMPLEEIA